ncbi:lipoprotein [Massilia sp. Mn16-1_5]|uniref:LPS translocon maturation chaperone LptM n=1 Tax=Massilia sp. Mn16-1_5 TaxID=2079199 RepID=UPI001B34AE82|nr:lipoprotein [Massilia sp. Mn16-1_5]
MKSPTARLITTAIPTALAIVLGGCGQTGPLYMPRPPAKPAAAPVKPVTPVVSPTSEALPPPNQTLNPPVQ